MEQEPFKPHGDSLLRVLSTYLPYESFKELESVSSSFRDEMRDVSEDQNTWYRRIREEFNISVPEKLWGQVDLKVIYKILNEIYVNKKHVTTPSIYGVKYDPNRYEQKIISPFPHSSPFDEMIDLSAIREKQRKIMINKIIDYLLQRGGYPRDALSWAISNSYTNLLKFLLSDPNVEHWQKSMALKLSSSDGGYLKIIELLIKDPSIDPSEDNNSNLRNAFRQGYTEIVDLLLQNPKVRESYRQEQLSNEISGIIATYDRSHEILNIWETIFNKYGLSIY